MSITRRALLAVPIPAALAASTKAIDSYTFHHENILGTSLDLTVHAARKGQAKAAESLILAEIARLEAILSTYKPASEISRLNSTIQPFHCSHDLFALLSLYQRWSLATGGVISATPRSREQLQLDSTTRTANRPVGSATNVDALGKAYILDRAAARAIAESGVSHLMLNIGGDIVFTQSPSAWTVGIANPERSHDNATPLTSVAMHKGAIAASGSYARGPHIIDARTGKLAPTSQSATAIAADAVTANALATALCVLSPQAGLSLVNTIPAVEALIVTSESQFRTAHFAGFEQPILTPVAANPNWPVAYEVAITITLKTPENRGYRRPYVAVWAEDASGRTVRTIALWVNRPRWVRDLYAWYRTNQSTDWNSIARATREAGKYRIVWDGLDDNGHAVAAGTYKITVESDREHGDYSKESASIDCSSKKSSAILKENLEFEAGSIEFGPHTDKA